MLRTPSSILLSTSRRTWHPSLKLLNSRTNAKQSGAFTHLLSNFHTIHTNFRDEKREKIRLNGLPRILLPSQHPSSLQQTRFLSAQPADDNAHSKSLREKIADQRERGKVAAAKGAHSFKEMVSRYGPLFVGTYLTVYVSTLATFFGLVETGLVDPAYLVSWIADAEDTKSTAEFIVDFLGHYTLTSPFVPYVESNPSMANLAIAWIAVKFTEPIRFGVTVAIVPSLARSFGFTPQKDPPQEAKGDSSANSDTSNESVKN